MKQRHFLVLAGIGVPSALVMSAFWFASEPNVDPDEYASPTTLASVATLERAGVIQVWKSPTCGCCVGWIEHLRAAGFEVAATDVDDMAALKAEYGIPGSLQTCHTALVDGYLLEGHVPAEDIERLLTERPQVTGLAVPGMPFGSPGMEMGNQVQRYDVISFDGEGRTEVFSSHGR